MISQIPFTEYFGDGTNYYVIFKQYLFLSIVICLFLFYFTWSNIEGLSWIYLRKIKNSKSNVIFKINKIKDFLSTVLFFFLYKIMNRKMVHH
jgi:hypothetical protein